MMHSKRILSELSNLSFETFCDTRLVAGASDGASVRVHWPLLVSRGVWWTRGVEENVEEGDRIVILPDVSYVELKNFVGFEMKFWKYNFNMSADCRNFLEMVLTNAVMEGETERHANAGEEFQNRYCFWSQRKSIAVSMTLYTERVPMISPRRLTLVS